MDAKSQSGDGPEYWIPMGRRLRVRRLKGVEGDIPKFAQSLSWDGKVTENPNYISLEQIADKTSGYGFYDEVGEVLGLGTKNEQAVQDKIDATRSAGEKLGTVTDPNGNSNTSSADGIFGLDSSKARFTYINPVMCLGTEEDEDGVNYKTPGLASSDHDRVYNKQAGGTYTCPTVYAMCVTTPINNANMMGTSWIGEAKESCTDLNSWNDWLYSNGFVYQVDIDKILELLGVVIDIQNQESEGLAFNGDTLIAVQNQLDETASGKLERMIKTISKIVSFMIQAYGLILIGAWIFDTNIYAGPGLVKMLTAGQWEAVKEKSDYTVNTDDVKYVDLKDMLIALVKFTAIGVLLWFFDFYRLKDIIDTYIEPLINTLKKMIIGG